MIYEIAAPLTWRESFVGIILLLVVTIYGRGLQRASNSSTRPQRHDGWKVEGHPKLLVSYCVVLFISFPSLDIGKIQIFSNDYSHI